MRRRSYPWIGLGLSLAAPGCLWAARALDGSVLRGALCAFLLALHAALLAAAGWFVGRKLDRLRSLANTDPLTGLFNRRRLDERLDDELERSARYGIPLSLLALDLDGMKAINERAGHLVGDRALQAVARSLVATARASDLVARVGGDEFVVLLPETGAPSAMALARRIAMAVALLRGAWDSALSISIGVTDLYGMSTMPRDDLLRAADVALHRAKVAAARARGGTVAYGR